MRKVLFAAVLFLAFSLPAPVRAQNAISDGSIAGRVTDASGAAVPDANVAATNNGTGIQQKTKTNSLGLFNFPVMSVGIYTLTVSHDGFKTIQVRNVVVQIGQTTSEDVRLEVGTLEQQVTVEASSPLFRPTESTVTTVVNQTLIEELPLSGRRYTDFVLLTPNANADGEFGLVSIGGQQGGQDSGYSNGNGSNSFTVDGANDTSNYFGDARGRTRVPYIFGEQSIREFQVADNPYSAAYGGAGSGFINTATKSGTDTFHGDAFYYNRNSGTGANDAVDKANSRPKPLNVLQQFGADLGGPIVRHRLWFYFDYEQQRQKSPISVINSGYAAVDQTFFRNVTSSTTLPPPNGPFPVPANFPNNNAPLPTDTTNYPIYLQQVSNALNAIHSNLGQRKRRRDDVSFFPKVDWQPGADDHFTFVYNYNKFNSPGGTFTFNPVASFGIEALPNNFVRDHHSSAHWTHIFKPNLLNDFHVSFLRDEQIGSPSGLIDPKLPSVLLFPEGFFALGNATFAVADTKEFQWEFGEQLNWIQGRHNFKFGLDINRTHVTDFFPGNFFGTYGFFSLTNFALGRYGFFNQGGGNPFFPFTFPYYGFYAQDKFQVRHNLTLDLGLREDFQVYPQPKPNPAFPLTGQFPNRYRRVSPRFGFAYQAFGKTVIRGGFGMFYQILNGLNYENSVISNGLSSQQSTASASFDPTMPANGQSPTFPNTINNASLFSGSSNISLVDPGFKTPYVLQSSLEIQQQLTSNMTVSVGTMWTHAVHLISSNAFDLNLVRPTGTTTYIVCPPNAATPSACTGPKVVLPTLDNGLLSEGANLGQINALISPGMNHYNSFYFRFQRHVSRGLDALVSYTFSKNVLFSGADFSNQFDFSNTKGPSLLDQRHRLSIAGLYQTDGSRWHNSAVRALLANWTISTVMQFSSGRPYAGLLASACTSTNFSPTASFSSFSCDGSGDNLNDSAFNQSTGNTATGINGAGPSPNIGLNSFYGPWIQEVDLGIARLFHLTEKQTFTVKVQVFNLANHPNFFVQTGRGINQVQYTPFGANTPMSPTDPLPCGDGATANQVCYLLPQPGFQTLQSISELNGPRILQFAFQYRF